MNIDINEGTKNIKREWIESLTIILIVMFINIFIFGITTVRGESMDPTLNNNDRLLLKKYGATLQIEKYDRGDIVVFKSPLEKDKRLFIKRIIGLPGDKINILDGKVFVNDKCIEETYIKNNSYTEELLYGENFTVPEGEIFVVGDNRLRGGSNDSRSFGSIPLEDIKGKVILRVFLLISLEKISDNIYSSSKINFRNIFYI